MFDKETIKALAIFWGLEFERMKNNKNHMIALHVVYTHQKQMLRLYYKKFKESEFDNYSGYHIYYKKDKDNE